ncbi:MAG: LamG-like jellyroll fold domain-containing protein [Verrucomicrobiota bacterium]
MTSLKSNLLVCSLLGLSTHASLAAADSYWPLNDGSGTVAVNAGTGSNGTLNGGVNWVTDPQRGTVAEFNGAAGTYIAAGTVGVITPASNFTWAFWSKADAAQPLNNDIMVGNRQPDSGWAKFTPNQFEYRDNAPVTFNDNINYPDFTASTWTHNSVVKQGRLMTYFRNGIALGNVVSTGTENLDAGTPLYFGGDAAAGGEGWQGRLSDVATWTSAVPVTSVSGIARGIYTPANAPGSPAAAVLAPVLSDNFSSGLANWTATERGLENVGPAGLNAPSTAGNQVVLGGTVTSQYWFGSSIESNLSFNSSLETEISVDRVSLTGSGTAFRSSLWIYGDADHYLHFSQNFNEGGWGYNAKDVGGTGAASATGSGNNLALADSLDADTGSHEMGLNVIPTGVAGQFNVEIRLDGVLQAVQGFSNFPSEYKVILTGQTRAIGDSVNAVFDNLLVQQVPEPTAAMLALAALGLSATRRRR